MGLANDLISFSYPITDLLADCIFKQIESLLSPLTLFPVELPHNPDLLLKVIFEYFELVFEPGSESFKRVIDPLGLSLGKVTVRLDFPLDVLKLRF